jgi:hypothetical protein
MGARGRTILLAFCLASGGGPAQAAEPTLAAEIRRAVAMVGASTSEQPALREERRAREPSAGFMLGAALGAWANAAAQLEFDLQNPAGIGPPHAHLGQDGDELLRQDCREEAVAFADLVERSQALGLAPQAVTAAAGAAGGAVVEPWLRRRPGPAAACR